MVVVGISGSPRKGGNSEKILAQAKEYFKTKGIGFKQILLSETDIVPCVHCDFCKKNDYCSKDETANEVNSILADADGIFAVTPVYFGGMTGQLKCLADKTLPLRRNGFKLKGKVGAAIAVGGSRNGGQELVLQNIHSWMLIHGMVIVGDNSHFGGTVHNPFKDDSFGEGTVSGTFEAMADLIIRINK